MLLNLREAKKYKIVPEVRKNKIIGINVFNGFKKVFPGTLKFSDVSGEALDYLKETVFKDKELVNQNKN